jgi:hypothetical protein
MMSEGSAARLLQSRGQVHSKGDIQLSKEIINNALRITLQPLIQDAMEAGKTLPEILYISKQAALRAAARLETAGKNGEQLTQCPQTE